MQWDVFDSTHAYATAVETSLLRAAGGLLKPSCIVTTAVMTGATSRACRQLCVAIIIAT